MCGFYFFFKLLNILLFLEARGENAAGKNSSPFSPLPPISEFCDKVGWKREILNERRGRIRREKRNWLPGQTWQAFDCTPSQSASTCCWSATRKKRETGVRKRYADRWMEGHKETQLRGEIQSSVRKCTKARHPPNQPSLSHTHTNTHTSVDLCLLAVCPCGPLAVLQP